MAQERERGLCTHSVCSWGLGAATQGDAGMRSDLAWAGGAEPSLAGSLGREKETTPTGASARRASQCRAPCGWPCDLGTCEAVVLLWKTSEHLLDPFPRLAGLPSLAVSPAWSAKPGDPGCLGLTPAPPLAGLQAGSSHWPSCALLLWAVAWRGQEASPRLWVFTPAARVRVIRGQEPLCWADLQLSNPCCVSSGRLRSSLDLSLLPCKMQVTITPSSVS